MPEAFHAQFPVSVKSFVSSAFGLRPKKSLFVADEAPRLTREKTLGVQGERY